MYLKVNLRRKEDQENEVSARKEDASRMYHATKNAFVRKNKSSNIKADED